MIIKLINNISDNQLEKIEKELQPQTNSINRISTQYSDYLVAIVKADLDLRKIGGLDGVEDVHRVSDAYKLVSSKWKVGKSAIDLGGGMSIGNGEFQIMAGPCSIESEEQIKSTIAHLKANNIKIMRGGVYKPRSSPYSFRGLGMDGLKLWYQLAKEADIKIVTEVMQVSQIEPMLDYVDIFQIGARNSQNFNLLDEIGRVDKPVLLKRGMSGTIEELLQSAEYIFSNGNEKIILCERGIRTYETAYRNTLDLNAVAILKDRSHLPVVVDPSHGIGVRKYVRDLALAGVVVGADGIIMEVHDCPQKALSDGQQTLDYDEAKYTYGKMRAVRSLLNE